MASLRGAFQFQSWLVLVASVAGLVCAILIGLVVGRVSVIGALLILMMLITPILTLATATPLWVFLGLSPLAWQWELGSLSALNLLSIWCLGTWIAGILVKRQAIPLRVSAVDLGVMLFFFISLASIVARSPEQGDWYFRIYTLNLALYFLARSVATTLPGLHGGLWAFVLGTSAAAAIGIWNYAQGTTVRMQGVERLGSETVGVNNFAAVLLAGAAIAFGLLLAEQRKAPRLILLSTTVLLVLAVTLSLSRGAFVGQAVLILCGVFLVRGNRHRRIFIALGAAMLSLLTVSEAGWVSLGDYSDRVRTLVFGDALDTPRPHLWRMGLEAISEQPLIGLGVGNFTRPDIWFSLATWTNAPPWVIGPSDVHSFFLGTVVDVGLLGAVPLALSLTLIGIGVVRALRSEIVTRTSTLAGPAYALAFGLASYFTAIAFLPAQTLPWPYVLVGLAEGLRRVVVQEIGEGIGDEGKDVSAAETRSSVPGRT